MASQVNFTKPRRNYTALLKLFQNIGVERTLPKTFYEATINLIPKPEKTLPKKLNTDAKIPKEILSKNECDSIHKKDHTPQSGVIHPQLTRMVKHTQNQCDTLH